MTTAREAMLEQFEKELQAQTKIMRCCQITARLAGGAITTLAEYIDDIRLNDCPLEVARRALDAIQKNTGYYLTPITQDDNGGEQG